MRIKVGIVTIRVESYDIKIDMKSVVGFFCRVPLYRAATIAF